MAAKKPGGTELSDFVEVVLEVDGERSLFRFYVVDYTWTRQGAREDFCLTGTDWNQSQKTRLLETFLLENIVRPKTKQRREIHI